MNLAVWQGFQLGLGLILAIGAQNAFVLRQGLRREHVFAVAATCAISDAVLILSGVAGFGALVDAAPWIESVFRYGGAAFLIVYGARAFYTAATATDALDPAALGGGSLRATLLTCLALTWLNPHVYLDTLVLVGSISTQFGEDRWWFGGGAATASLVFFFTLAYGARLLRPLFARPAAWRVLDLVVGAVMWSIAASLLLH